LRPSGRRDHRKDPEKITADSFNCAPCTDQLRVWATTWSGAFYAADTSGDTIDKVSGPFWPGTAFVAVTPCGSNSAPATCPAPPKYPANYLGRLNMYTGQITPVPLRGPRLEPQGMIYVPF